MKCCPTLLPDYFQHVCGMRIAKRKLEVKNKEKTVLYREINRKLNKELEDVFKEAKAFLEVNNSQLSVPPL